MLLEITMVLIKKESTIKHMAKDSWRAGVLLT